MAPAPEALPLAYAVESHTGTGFYTKPNRLTYMGGEHRIVPEGEVVECHGTLYHLTWAGAEQAVPYTLKDGAVELERYAARVAGVRVAA